MDYFPLLRSQAEKGTPNLREGDLHFDLMESIAGPSVLVLVQWFRSP
jgi:hypothetical protein